MATLKAFNTGKFSEKVLALSGYDNTIITNLYQNPINKQKINRGAAFIIKNYFDQYLDQQARQNSNAYHHVYEFDKTGQSSARLFKAVVSNIFDSAVITYTFTQAQDPNREGYNFPNKAAVMEEGRTLTITPRKDKYLKYTLQNGRFVTSEKSVVRNPGGPLVAGSFERTFNQFMATTGQTVLDKFGFFKKIERSIIEKRRLVVPRINSGLVTEAINTAKRDADQIAGGVVSYYV